MNPAYVFLERYIQEIILNVQLHAIHVLPASVVFGFHAVDRPLDQATRLIGYPGSKVSIHAQVYRSLLLRSSI